MRRFYAVFVLLMLLCIGCEWHLTSSGDNSEKEIVVERYDRIQSLYLTTGDFSALQQMNTNYPQQTRTLIEDVLHIGRVNEPEINIKFLNFYQDTTLQVLINSAEQQYANMDDINQQLNDAFVRLRELLPDIEMPLVYAQIGSLDQSIVVVDGRMGISLDKYLGTDYPIYLRYGYSEQQRKMMTREYIVPDCLGFYLLSLFPLPGEEERHSVELRHWHMAKIQWVVNQAMNSHVFSGETLNRLDKYKRANPKLSASEMMMLAPDVLADL